PSPITTNLRTHTTSEARKLPLQRVVDNNLSIRRKRHSVTITRDRRLQIPIGSSRFSQLIELHTIEQKDLPVSIGISPYEILARRKHDAPAIMRHRRTDRARFADFRKRRK